MENEIVKMAVPESIIHGIVEQSINAQVLKAMEGKEGLIAGIVHSAITRRVDSEGRYTDSSYCKTTLLDFLCDRTIKSAVESAIKAYVENAKPEIEKAVAKALKTKSKDLATAFMQTILNTAQSSYRLTVKLDAKEDQPR